MQNYFKVFRVRALLPEFEIGGRELPEESFVFFDDADQIATKRAAALAGRAIATMEQKKLVPKICAFARVSLYPTIEAVGEGL